MGIDIRRIMGTSFGGRVTKDVLRFDWAAARGGQHIRTASARRNLLTITSSPAYAAGSTCSRADLRRSARPTWRSSKSTGCAGRLPTARSASN
jgi:hypothetical protein